MNKLLLIGFSTFMLSACTAPANYIKEGINDKINFAYTKKNTDETKRCIKSRWANRDIHGVLQVHQLPPLVEVPMDGFDRLSWYTTILFDIYRENSQTVIRQSHQIDIHPAWKSVAKDVMIQCSEKQTFSNLLNVNERAFSR